VALPAAGGDSVTGTAHLIRGNALALPLPDASVDLVVTSPPYFALRSYRDGGEHYDGQLGDEATPAEFVDALIAVTREMVRVLKPAGSIFVNLGDKYQATSFSPQKRGKDASGVKRPAATLQCERCGDEFTGGPGRRFCSSFCGGSDNSRRSDRDGAPVKSLLGIPWRYALRCIDTSSGIPPAVVRRMLADVHVGALSIYDAGELIAEYETGRHAGLGLILRAEIAWSKPNGLPESVTDRVRRSHETWFHLVKQPRYYSAIDEIRESYGSDSLRPSKLGVMSMNARNASTGGGATQQAGPNQLGKLPGSVWEIATQPLTIPVRIAHSRCCNGRKRDGCEDGIDHYAAFPMEWPRRLIRGWSPNGICTACGEGRRPVPARFQVDRSRPQARRALALVEQHGLTDEHIAAVRAVGVSDTGRGAATQSGTGKNTPEVYALADVARAALGGYAREFLLQRPTGIDYACSCPDTTAPTAPAVVLDPFGGTGTTALVAKVLGRTGISVDMSSDYSNVVAQWRVNDPDQIAAAMQVPRNKTRDPGTDQLDMFGESA
jgi:DNA modification methylase